MTRWLLLLLLAVALLGGGFVPALLGHGQASCACEHDRAAICCETAQVVTCCPADGEVDESGPTYRAACPCGDHGPAGASAAHFPRLADTRSEAPGLDPGPASFAPLPSTRMPKSHGSAPDPRPPRA